MIQRTLAIRASAPTIPTRVLRLARISKFAISTIAKTQLLSRKAITPRHFGAWIAADAIALGPLFVKLVQLASARSDVLDPELVEALSVVQDEVIFDGIQRPEIAGYVVDAEPLKSGSVASVWMATRASGGGRVVVKKLHEGVRETFERDLPTLVGVLRAATAARAPGADNFYEIVSESVDMLLREADLSLEAAAMTEFRSRAPAGIVVPRVIEASTDYIVEEYVPSRKISSVKGPNPALARRLMLFFATSILEIGIVHADMHPGNVGVTPTGGIVLYDFGAVVETTRLRASLGKLVTTLAARDLEGFVGSLQKIGVIDAGRGSDTYRVVRILEGLLELPTEDFHVSLSQQPEFSDSSGRRLVRFNPEAVYLLRSLNMVEGTCRTLDPDFSYETYWNESGGLRELFEKNVEVEVDFANAFRSWLVSATAVPDNLRKTLDAAQQLNFELRDEITATRALVYNVSFAAAAAVVLARFL